MYDEDLLEEDILWIKKGDVIFKKGENPIEYAYFGWQSSMGLGVMYYGYIKGYKEAADTLVDYSLQMLRDGRIDIADTYVYPICFMYRHFMELALKSIYICYSTDDDNKKEKNIKYISHDLVKIWNVVRPIIEKYSIEQDKADIDVAEEYIFQMNHYQETSFEFRYPTKKNGNTIHQHWAYLDLVNLKEKMERFYNYYMAVKECIPINMSKIKDNNSKA